MEITQQQMKEWMDVFNGLADTLKDAKKALQQVETPVRNWITVQKAYALLARLKENWDKYNESGPDKLDDDVERFSDAHVEGVLLRQDDIEGRVYVYDGWDGCKVTMPDGRIMKSDECANSEMAMHDVMWAIIEDLVWNE